MLTSTMLSSEKQAIMHSIYNVMHIIRAVLGNLTSERNKNIYIL